MKVYFIFLVILILGCASQVDNESLTPNENLPIIDSDDLKETNNQKASNPLEAIKEKIQKLSDHRPGWEIISDYERSQLPDCSDTSYTYPPVDLDVLEVITPLGNLNPPAHTIPTEHPYLALKKDWESTEVFDLYAPGDVWITHVKTGKGQTQDPEDSSIFFALCKDVFGYYNHVKDLSPTIDKIVKMSESDDPIIVFEKVDAGTVLGKVGRLQGNFDFGTWDDSKKDNAYINSGRYSERSLKIACAFDYYPEPLRTQLYEKIDRPDGKCGDVNYDKENTVQGSWFVGDSDVTDWQTTMIYLGPDNDNPELSVISASDIGGGSLLWKFAAETSGNVNLQFDKTTTNTVYCYDEDEWTGQNYENAWGAKGKILFRTDGKVLEVDHKSGKCSDSESINNPVRYAR